MTAQSRRGGGTSFPQLGHGQAFQRARAATCEACGGGVGRFGALVLLGVVAVPPSQAQAQAQALEALGTGRRHERARLVAAAVWMSGGAAACVAAVLWPCAAGRRAVVIQSLSTAHRPPCPGGSTDRDWESKLD